MNKQQQRAAKLQRQQDIVNAARTANRSLTESEQAEFDTFQREIESLNAEIEAEATANQARALQPEQQQTPAAPVPQPQAADGTRSAEPAVSSAEIERALQRERTRVSEITGLCREFDTDPSQFIANGSNLDQVREAIINQLRTERGPIATGVRVTGSGEDDFRRDVSDALLLRSGQINVENPTAGARQLVGMSLRDLAIECMSREGGNMGTLLRMGSDDLYAEMCRQFYNPSAAFPAIMDQTIRKSIVDLYSRVPTTFQAFTTKGTLRDFKQTADHEYVIGGVGDFLLVPENGEIKPDMPRTELLPQRKLDTYGKQFSMTRQAFINDDIGFLTEVPGLYATAAKKTIDKQVYRVLFDNEPLKFADGKPLFHKDHNNLIATGSKPTQASIQEMILQMQRQTDHFGEPIYITPRLMVLPVGYEFDLAVIFHSTQVTGSNHNDINPLYNYPLTFVQSPLLNAFAGKNACPWFMFGDGARGIQVDYLNGQETPTVRRMETPGQLGFVWDIYLDWGIAVRDFRGIAKNPGVAI